MWLRGHLIPAIILFSLFAKCVHPQDPAVGSHQKPAINGARVFHLASGGNSQHGLRNDPAFRIINGNEVTNREDVPWMALVICDFVLGPFQCGGTLISDQYVLTSAYCLTFLEERTTSCKINLGGVTGTICAALDEAEEVQYRSIKIVVHPNFDDVEEVSRKYDIGLIKLNQTVTQSSKIRPISIPTADMNYKDLSVTLFGWGATETNDASSTVRKTQNTVRDDDTCDWVWNCPDADISTKFYDPATNICYGGNGETGDCWGDEGGPVVLGTGVNAKQVAIISNARLAFEDSGSSGCPSRNFTTTTPSGTVAPKASKLTVLSNFISRILGLFGRGAGNVSRARSLRPPAGPARGGNRESKTTTRQKSHSPALRRSPRQDYECWLDTPSLGTKLSMELVNWINQNMT